MIYYGTGIPIYLSYFLINAALLHAALKILGFKFMVKTIYAIIMLGRVLIFEDLLIVGSSFFVFNAKPEFTTIDAVRR